MRYLSLVLLFGLLHLLDAAEIAPAAGSTGSTPPADSALVVPVAEASAQGAQRCTLSIVTQPDGASVSIDGKNIGSAPVKMVEVDTGKHTIILQKAGYFQKKVVLTLIEAGHTPLTLSLVAPGTLAITTSPDSAIVILNGEVRGAAPYTDSLLKPGTYRIEIKKESYVSIVDTFEIAGGSVVVRHDTLHFTSAYTDSVNVLAKNTAIKKKRFTVGAVAGSFALFLLTLLIIERHEN